MSLVKFLWKLAKLAKVVDLRFDSDKIELFRRSDGVLILTFNLGPAIDSIGEALE